MGTPTGCPFADTHKETACILQHGCASIAPTLLTFPCTISLLSLPPSAPIRVPKDIPGHGDPFVPRPKGAASSERSSVPPPQGSPKAAQRSAHHHRKPNHAALSTATQHRHFTRGRSSVQQPAHGAAPPGSGRPGNAINHSAATSRCPGPAERCEQVRIAAGVYTGSRSSSATGKQRRGRGRPSQITNLAPCTPCVPVPHSPASPAALSGDARASPSSAPLPRVFLLHAQRRSPAGGSSQLTSPACRFPTSRQPPRAP